MATRFSPKSPARTYDKEGKIKIHAGVKNASPNYIFNGVTYHTLDGKPPVRYGVKLRDSRQSFSSCLRLIYAALAPEVINLYSNKHSPISNKLFARLVYLLSRYYDSVENTPSEKRNAKEILQAASEAIALPTVRERRIALANILRRSIRAHASETAEAGHGNGHGGLGVR